MARKTRDNETGYLWAQEGEQREGLIAQVAPILPIEKTYSFAVPDDLKDSLSLGRRVMVPMGRAGRLVQGFVVNLDRMIWQSTLSPIASVVDSAGYLNDELIELGRRIAEHYACPLGTTLKAMTPEAVRRERGFRTVRYAELAGPVEQITAGDTRVTPQRRSLLDALVQAEEPVRVDALLASTGVSAAVLQGVVKKGWVYITQRKEARAESPDVAQLIEPDYELNGEQRVAVDRIRSALESNRFWVGLLYGVSGSGKTEVYIRAMREVISQGKQAILLVPEIVLTTQLVRRLACRFADVAVVHSALSEVQRSLMWRRIATGEMKVVIGTRSAVFAPLPDLGLICVDEEQENSYKNLQAPRFHVRDVAIMRAHGLGIPIVLGSATPSLETWHNASHREHYEKISLTKRVKNLPLPKVHVVDMAVEHQELGREVLISRTMQRLLSEALDRKEQAVILMNRRGYARRVRCPACRTPVRCPNCDVNLVVHQATGQSICHYCRSRVTTPTHCPQVACGEKLVLSGAGTQRVEDVLSRLFPGAVIQRVDSDTMKHRRQYREVVDRFEAQEVDILVGTQMVAKGLDFPFVSFVGVIDADVGALATDFRAQEHLFQLMTQVAGRAGRADTGGEVVIQTLMPDALALRCAVQHDYESFAQEELTARKRHGLPPFGRLARIVLAHEREQLVSSEAKELADRITETIDGEDGLQADVLGPSPCPLSRLRGRYRYEVLLRTRTAASLRELIKTLRAAGRLRTKARSTTIDVDPVSMS